MTSNERSSPPIPTPIAVSRLLQSLSPSLSPSLPQSVLQPPCVLPDSSPVTQIRLADPSRSAFRPPNQVPPPLGLGLGLFPRPSNRRVSHPLPAHQGPYSAPPIAATALSLATHPELSRPLPAVLSAGSFSPGTRYSRSPSVASLESIISQASPPRPSASKRASPPNERESGGTPNLTSWWSAIASAFGIEGLNDTETATSLGDSKGSSEPIATPAASSSASGHVAMFGSQPADQASPPRRREATSSSTASTTTTRFSNWWTSGTSTRTTSQSGELDSESAGRGLDDEPPAILGPSLGQHGQRRRSFKKPRHPLVLCHGLFGFDLIGPQSLPPLRICYWRGVKEALENQGVEVLVARVPACASIEERARILAQFIEEKLPGRQVNLIGHSMGGLDSRFLITHLKPTSFKVVSLTTIATPHRGSAFADYLLLDLVGRKNLPKLLTLTQRLGIPGGGKAFEELTMQKMAKFNTETPNEPSVAYFSYGAAFQPGFTDLFRIPWGVIYEREGPNDGLVSVSSAIWGEYRGTLENVNHLDLVGWTGRLRYAYAEWTGKKIAFEPPSFFLQVAESLADRGF